MILGGEATLVRYAKSIRIDVELQTDTTQGVIYPPAIQVEYSTVTLADAQAGGEVEVCLVFTNGLTHFEF
jgi:hypothetical protein